MVRGHHDWPVKSPSIYQNQVKLRMNGLTDHFPSNYPQRIPLQKYFLKILPFQCLLIGKGRNWESSQFEGRACGS